MHAPEPGALAPPCSPIPGLALWHGCMADADQAAQQGDIERARHRARRALRHAEALLAGATAGAAPADAAARVHAVVASRHMLAELCAVHSAKEDAVEHLCRAHRTVLALLADPSRPVALRQAAWRHQGRTHAALLAHAQRHGPHAAIARALCAGRPAACTVQGAP